MTPRLKGEMDLTDDMTAAEKDLIDLVSQMESLCAGRSSEQVYTAFAMLIGSSQAKATVTDICGVIKTIDQIAHEYCEAVMKTQLLN